MSKNFLIYGANGYTGELIAREAGRRGLKPLLAGRNAEKIKLLANELGFDYRIFSLDERAKLAETLGEVACVIHCAGPFSQTAAQMVEACLETGRHYLDITGEITVFEAIAARDAEAQSANVMLMPGVGFDVVPTDCLAKHLKERLPTATELTLALSGMSGISHGTLATMITNLGRGGAVRRDGKIESVPACWKTRQIDFGDGQPVMCSTIPWGDVATAYYSTGIPNIEVYAALPAAARAFVKISRYFGRVLSAKAVQSFLIKQIPAGGPSEQVRRTAKSSLYGEVADSDGRKVSARLICPEAYRLTSLTALKIAEKVLEGNCPPGFQTPAKAFGADLILEIEGVQKFS